MQDGETWSPTNGRLTMLLIRAARMEGYKGWISPAVLQRRLRVSKDVATWLTGMLVQA